MSFNKDEFNLQILDLKQNIKKQAKRALKREVPNTESSRTDIRDNLVVFYNDFTTILANSWK